MSRPTYIADRHQLLGPGVAEAMRDPAHMSVVGMAPVDYGPQWDDVPRSNPRPSLWRRLWRFVCRG